MPLRYYHVQYQHISHLFVTLVMMPHHNCLLFIIIPPVMVVHVMLKRIECEKRICLTKLSQGKTELHLYLSIWLRNKKYKPPLIISCMM